ncbi:hypothetical protein HMPREF2946_04750 [Actinomyces sp. HMSC062G12]|nr:hypothetical protein HMPREF2946_04750 [Actinomyces sp. HMSC062G12]
MEGYVYARVIVEGETDEPVINALMRAAGWNYDQFEVTSANGKGVIDRDIKKNWEAARTIPHVIFRDLDRDGEGCPVTLRAELVERTPGESPDLLIRIVDQCIESWILADQQGIAEFCKRSTASVKQPVSHHKPYLLSIMKEAKLKDAVEQKGRELDFGPMYGVYLERLMTHHWSAARAADASDSLRRALERLTDLHDRLEGGAQ